MERYDLLGMSYDDDDGSSVKNLTFEQISSFLLFNISFYFGPLRWIGKVRSWRRS